MPLCLHEQVKVEESGHFSQQTSNCEPVQRLNEIPPLMGDTAPKEEILQRHNCFMKSCLVLYLAFVAFWNSIYTTPKFPATWFSIPSTASEMDFDHRATSFRGVEMIRNNPSLGLYILFKRGFTYNTRAITHYLDTRAMRLAEKLVLNKYFTTGSKIRNAVPKSVWYYMYTTLPKKIYDHGILADWRDVLIVNGYCSYEHVTMFNDAFFILPFVFGIVVFWTAEKRRQFKAKIHQGDAKIKIWQMVQHFDMEGMYPMKEDAQGVPHFVIPDLSDEELTRHNAAVTSIRAHFKNVAARRFTLYLEQQQVDAQVLPAEPADGESEFAE